jgi:ubiquinone biosynthesis accessory factor UbiJ
MSTPSGAVCAALNFLFRQQPTVLDLLAVHSGRSFRLVARPLEDAFTIGHDGCISPADLAVAVDVTVELDMQALWAAGWRPGQPLPDAPGFVHVSGDAALAQTLSMLAKSWRLDFEDLLAHMIGDIPAKGFVQGAKQIVQAVALGAQRLSGNVAEFVAYEQPILTPTVLFNQHKEQLASLNSNLTQLAQRLEQLDRRALNRPLKAPASAHRGRKGGRS